MKRLAFMSLPEVIRPHPTLISALVFEFFGEAIEHATSAGDVNIAIQCNPFSPHVNGTQKDFLGRPRMPPHKKRQSGCVNNKMIISKEKKMPTTHLFGVSLHFVHESWTDWRIWWHQAQYFGQGPNNHHLGPIHTGCARANLNANPLCYVQCEQSHSHQGPICLRCASCVHEAWDTGYIAWPCCPVLSWAQICSAENKELPVKFLCSRTRKGESLE